ncbi:CPBP family intramembrane metalloprotease [Viridibacillus sp. YIM B01967]|uniref:CPBP family intramembrane metalloprotease n=1 Tax=Viridibacillus soli TaxID=2798301 RepID=A0ABS1H6M3_9BACL|nr:CPBP family intramembrane glutamic endopeptidase [Viridibacillus soli]MBK3495068.1 CPBP family intramembrane metalloprotease [Viridibacillus soli]
MKKIIKQHSLAKSMLLHVLPGIFLLPIYLLFLPIVQEAGYPNFMALYLAALVGGVPIQLCILLFVAKKQTNTYKISAILSFKNKLTIKEYIIYVPILLLVSGVLVSLSAPIDQFLFDTVFSFMKTKFNFTDIHLLGESHSILVITAIIGILTNGLLAPFVEELYFRGYLLPRISRFGKIAVILNVAGFSLYHLFSPWQFFSRLFGIIPWVWVVWQKQSIRLGMFVHMTINTLSSISLIVMAS